LLVEKAAGIGECRCGFLPGLNYAGGMNSFSLPARIVYAVVALAGGGAAGFYSSIWLLPRVATYFQWSSAEGDGFDLFKAALGIGAAVALTAFLVAITLPWKRRRKRRGRLGRIVASGVVVVVASLGFAGQGHAVVYDLLFAAWLAYAMAFTFVRYGVLDQERRGPSPAEVTSAVPLPGKDNYGDSDSSSQNDASKRASQNDALEGPSQNDASERASQDDASEGA